MFRLLNLYLQPSNPATSFFSRGSLDSYSILGGQVTVTGDGNVAKLTFDVNGDRKQMIKTTLTVIRRADLENASFVKDAASSRTESYISNWTIITTHNNKTIVFSKTEDLALIFENMEGFPFETLRGKENQLGKLKYFQELDFVAEIQKRGYALDILRRGESTSSEAFKKVTDNLNAAVRALQVVSLEAILHIEKKEIDFPSINIERCVTRRGGGDSSCKIDEGDSPWVGRVQHYFGEFTLQLSREHKSVRGKFTRSKFESSFDDILASSNSIQLIHKWYVHDVKNQNIQQRFYICPDLQEVFTFEGDISFPVNKVSSNIVEHQFFYESALDQFMHKHGLSLEEAKRSPGWSEKKLQCLAIHLDSALNWINNGVSLKTFEQMSDNKFCHLLFHYRRVEDALNFLTLHDILGEKPKIDNQYTLRKEMKT